MRERQINGIHTLFKDNVCLTVARSRREKKFSDTTVYKISD